MKGGFSFCGIDIADLGLEYAPELQDTYVYRPQQYDLSEETFQGHDGGYFYGTTVKPKEFTLRCFYEGHHLNSGLLTKLFDIFKRGKTGRLVFQKRDWCWYTATVVKADDSRIANFINGVFTITMKAYYPFARTDKTYITDEDIALGREDDMMRNSAMLKGIEWDMDKNFVGDEPISITSGSTKSFMLYNPGTENASVCIEIAGNLSSGVKIHNKKTGQTCEVIGFNSTSGTYEGCSLLLDSLSGKCLIKNANDEISYGFLFHDSGFIDLGSDYPVRRNITMNVVPGTNNQFVVRDSDILLDSSYIGKHLILYCAKPGSHTAILGICILGYNDGEPNMILGTNSMSDNVYDGTITSVVDGAEEGTKVITVVWPNGESPEEENIQQDTPTQLINYNEIVVSAPRDDISITKLVFHFKPTFA